MAQPDFVICSKCKRRLDPSVYKSYPSDDVPEDRINRIYEPELAAISVQCSTCGYYTIFTNVKPK